MSATGRNERLDRTLTSMTDDLIETSARQFTVIDMPRKTRLHRSGLLVKRAHAPPPRMILKELNRLSLPCAEPHQSVNYFSPFFYFESK